MDQNQDQPLGLSCLHKVESPHHSVMMIFVPSVSDAMLHVPVCVNGGHVCGKTNKECMAVSIRKIYVGVVGIYTVQQSFGT